MKKFIKFVRYLEREERETSMEKLRKKTVFATSKLIVKKKKML